MSEPIHNLRDALAATPECPPLDLLAAPRPADGVRRHLENCAHCQAELSLLHQFESAEPTPREAADVAWIESQLARRSPAAAPSREPFLRRARAWFAFPLSPARLAFATGALLLLVTAGVVLRPGAGVGTVPSEDGAVWRSGKLTALSPSGDLPLAPSELRWEPVSGATVYHVRLLEVDGTELWSADAAAPAVGFPAPLAAKLIAGRAFQWDVIARNALGRPVAASDLQTFHILATPR